MAEIFELFGVAGSASPSMFVALLLEPLLHLIGYVAFVTISFRHYRKTKSKGALTVFLMLAFSAVSTITIEYFAKSLDDINYGMVEAASRVLEASLFLVLVWGFYLLCKESS